MADIIQKAYVDVMTRASLGKYVRKSDDCMGANDWDTQFVITPEGYLALHSSKTRWLERVHGIMLRLDPTDQCMWNLWTIALPCVAEELTPRQIDDVVDLMAFRLMRAITFLLAIGYVVRASDVPVDR